MGTPLGPILLLAGAVLPTGAPTPALAKLDAAIRASASATQALQQLCDSRPGSQARIVARRAAADDAAVPADVRAELRIDAAEPVVHRRVELMCDDLVLSVADNWYLPRRLTDEMNRSLTTDTPFGQAVKALNYARHTLAAETLPSGLIYRTRARVVDLVLRHRAVLATPDGVRFSLVAESYTSDALTLTAGR